VHRNGVLNFSWREEDEKKRSAYRSLGGSTYPVQLYFSGCVHGLAGQSNGIIKMDGVQSAVNVTDTAK